MSVRKFEGDPSHGGIPKGSYVRLEALPKRQLVFEGTVSEAFYPDLDPGKYCYSVTRLSSPRRLDDACYTGEFYYEIEEEPWKALQTIEPRLTKIMHTSEGVRWRCQFLGCEEESSNAVAAVIHEVEHFGVPKDEFLKDPRGAAAKVAGQKVADYNDALAKAKQVAAPKGKVLTIQGS